MAEMSVVFMHGAGRAGAAAWPHQAARAVPSWVFISRHPDGDDPAGDAQRILTRLEATGGGHVVAHSYGANAALSAAYQNPAQVWSLALLEPACFDLARGAPAVDAHVRAMTQVFDASDDPSVSARDFSRLFAAATGALVPDLPDEALEARAQRLRSMPRPWDLGLAAHGPLPVPTLVVTAGEAPLYEQVAEALTRLGAEHRVLEGAGHRVQDHPDATTILQTFWNSVPPTSQP